MNQRHVSVPWYRKIFKDSESIWSLLYVTQRENEVEIIQLLNGLPSNGSKRAVAWHGTGIINDEASKRHRLSSILTVSYESCENGSVSPSSNNGNLTLFVTVAPS